VGDADVAHETRNVEAGRGCDQIASDIDEIASDINEAAYSALVMSPRLPSASAGVADVRK